MHEGEGRHAWFDEPATTTGSLLAVPTVPPPALPGDDDPEVVAHEDADDLEDLDDAGPDEDGLVEENLVELVPVPRHPVHDLFRDPETGRRAPPHRRHPRHRDPRPPDRPAAGDGRPSRRRGADGRDRHRRAAGPPRPPALHPAHPRALRAPPDQRVRPREQPGARREHGRPPGRRRGRERGRHAAARRPAAHRGGSGDGRPGGAPARSRRPRPARLGPRRPGARTASPRRPR